LLFRNHRVAGVAIVQIAVFAQVSFPATRGVILSKPFHIGKTREFFHLVQAAMFQRVLSHRYTSIHQVSTLLIDLTPLRTLIGYGPVAGSARDALIRCGALETVSD
jgi:hypothetical protein